MTDQGKTAGSWALDVGCPRCWQGETQLCRTLAGRLLPVGREHVARWDARFGLTAGDVLVCEPYWLDPGVKLTVLYREPDGFDPQCNMYRPDVERVRGAAGQVGRASVLA